MTRRFVLVTATQAQRGLTESTCSGIRKLKRGVSLTEFMSGYLEQFNLQNPESFMRGESLVIIAREIDKVMTWSFTEYPELELLTAVRHLSREELLRDLKELLPLKDIK